MFDPFPLFCSPTHFKPSTFGFRSVDCGGQIIWCNTSHPIHPSLSFLVKYPLHSLEACFGLTNTAGCCGRYVGEIFFNKSPTKAPLHHHTFSFMLYVGNHSCRYHQISMTQKDTVIGPKYLNYVLRLKSRFPWSNVHSLGFYYLFVVSLSGGLFAVI